MIWGSCGEKSGAFGQVVSDWCISIGMTLERDADTRLVNMLHGPITTTKLH